MSEDFDDELDKIDELLDSIQQSRTDIATAEALEFDQKWHKETTTVPITLVDWSLILNLLMKEPGYEKFLGDWKTKAVSSDELRKSLGMVSHLEEPFLEFINGSRRSNIKQNIALFSKLGCIDLFVDESGKEKYVLLDYTYDGHVLKGFVEDTLKAYETFR